LELFENSKISVRGLTLLAKEITRNRITLPKTVVDRFTSVDYFEVSTDGASIILRPLQRGRAEEARARMAKLKVEEDDVKAAVAWARKKA
jgi:hypothetical protein